MEVAYGCAAGMPAGRLLRALRSGGPILPPRGRRLSGPEIRAAFSGRSLRATEWFPRVNVLESLGGGWRPDLLRPVPRRPARRRMALAGRGRPPLHHPARLRGGAVADGRFLQLVRGEPPRLRVTFVTAPPGTAPPEARGALMPLRRPTCPAAPTGLRVPGRRGVDDREVFAAADQPGLTAMPGRLRVQVFDRRRFAEPVAEAGEPARLRHAGTTAGTAAAVEQATVRPHRRSARHRRRPRHCRSPPADRRWAHRRSAPARTGAAR